MSSLFRAKSLKKVTSPEELDSYLRITRPPVWFAMAALVILLAGAIVWGCLAELETKTGGVIIASGDTTVCYVSEQDIGSIHRGTVVRTAEQEYAVTEIAGQSIPVGDCLSAYAMKIGGFEDGENVYALSLSQEAAPGNHACEIVLERISPITFLLDSSN